MIEAISIGVVIVIVIVAFAFIFGRNEGRLKVDFEVKGLRRLGEADQILGQGQANGVEVELNILFIPSYPVKIFQVMLEVHSKRIPTRTMMVSSLIKPLWLTHFFVLDESLMPGTKGRIVVTLGTKKTAMSRRRYVS